MVSRRLLGIVSSLLALMSGLVYNLIITRKLPIEGLGLLLLLNASLAFSMIPTGILNFIVPRLTARDGALNLKSMLFVATIFYAITAITTLIYLSMTWEDMGGYAYLVLTVAIVTEAVYYLQSVTSSILMVKDRGGFMVSSVLQSLTKLGVIPLIMALGWSIGAVLWSTVIMSLVPTIYMLRVSARFHAPIRRRYMREVVASSWVPLMGYALNGFRSLDAVIIGLFSALNQMGIFYVLLILGKLFIFSSTLVGVTYGELLERSRTNIIYRDLLVILILSTTVALSISFFEPIYMNLLRPSSHLDIQQIVILWMIANVLGNVNQYLSNAVQGLDRVDMSSEVGFRTYWGSAIFYMHLSELVFTVVYLGSSIPLIIIYEEAGESYYAVQGIVTASLLSHAVSLIFRIYRSDISRYVRPKDLLTDYIAPLSAALPLIYLVSTRLPMNITPSFMQSLTQVIIATAITSTIFIGLATALSRNVRELAKATINATRGLLAKPQR